MEISMNRMRTKAKILFEYNGNMLVLRPTNKRKMTLIGGSVDATETPVQAAIREAYEEAGIVLVADDLKTYMSCNTIIRGKSTTFYCFLIRHRNVPFELKEHHKFELIGWTSLNDGLKRLKGVEKEVSTKIVRHYILNSMNQYDFKQVI